MEGRRISREMSPERSKVYVQERVLMRPSFKKVHVVYYLSRNGHLEHPHYMEVNHLAHLPLRLKDVMDRLTVLRGKGMPSLYSWSCKRSYKNGYVWNDLAENDVVHPSEGAEYVLKGSELLTEACTEKLHHLQVSSNVAQILQTSVTNDSSSFQPKHKSLAFKRRPQPEEMMNSQYHSLEQDEDIAEEQQEEENEDKTRHSRGVSTNEVEEITPHETPKNELMSHNINSFSSPPSTTSSTSASDKANNDTTTNNNNNNNSVSTRFEDGDPVESEPLLSRNSMIFSLIACGGSGSFRKSSVPSSVVKQSPQCTVPRKSGSGINLRKDVVCKAAAKEEEMMMVGCMSENPRFGNLMSDEKEYFSGSIVESMTSEEKLGINEPGLKKSSSYNEERSSQAGLGEVVQEEIKKEKGAKGKCIPRKIF